MKDRLLHLFNIRKDEAWLVTNLFWLQFFQGVGVAIFNTIAFALFLERFDVHELPQVYLFAAVLLWITGFVYHKVEHALSMKKLVPVIILFVALSILGFRALYTNPNQPWFLFVMFSWFYVIYLLTNLEFWGLAALQFDIRQSKRLFGMIGAGDIPAKIIGYSAVPVLLKVFSSANMLVIAAASILCSLIFYMRLRRAGKMDVHVAHEHEHHGADHEKATQSIKSLITGVFGNRMIAYVAFLSFIVVTCVTIISFSFYSEIKHEAHSNIQLAAFISSFYVGGRIFAIFVRLIITGRLMHTLGTKGALLISPAIIFAFLIGIIALPLFTQEHRAVLYFFGLMAIITEVLKTSLQDPVFLSVMQPLSSHLRLKGHTIVKGVMDPFALAFTGLLLFVVVHISHKVDLFWLSYLLFALLIVWVVLVFMVDKEYVRTLVTALHKRYSVGTDINLRDEKTRDVLLEKLATGERGEAIYILNLIEKQYGQDKEELVLRALNHPRPEVRMEAIKLAERKRIIAALPLIEKIIEERTESAILPEAVKAICMLQPDELENLDVFVADSDHRLMKAAITGLMISGGISAVVTAGQRLLGLISSPNAEERKMAADIIGDLAVQSFYKPLLDLFVDNDSEVVKAAIAAAGKVKNERLIRPLMQMFLHGRNERLVVDALYEAGDISLKEVQNALTNERLSRQQQSKLILLCGRIGTENAAKLLDELVWKTVTLRSDIFHALHLCQFRLQPDNRAKHVELMNYYVVAATRVLFMIRETEKITTAKVLNDALYLELNEMRDQLLLLFSFVYDKEKMMKAKSAFGMRKRDAIANALEVIEIEVPKEISLKFNHIFEPGTIADRSVAMTQFFKEALTYESVIEEILNDRHHNYHRWTKAAALHSVTYYKGTAKRGWLEMAEQENDILLKETAEKILSEMTNEVTG